MTPNRGTNGARSAIDCESVPASPASILPSRAWLIYVGAGVAPASVYTVTGATQMRTVVVVLLAATFEIELPLPKTDITR